MHHKLQPSTLENNGSNSVVRDENSTSQSEIASNDADRERVASAAHDRSAAEPEIISSANPQATEMQGKVSGPARLDKSVARRSSESHRDAGQDCLGSSATTVPRTDSTASTQTPAPSTGVQQGRPDPRRHKDQPRCEVARSVGYDPTGEHAVACGALAEVVCEYCGPMCASCSEETFCYYGDHKLTQLPDDGPLPSARRRHRSVNEVVYVEIKCPNCSRVRLALPKKHRPQRVRKCPVCKTKAPAEYLAHGFTRRRLPYHEVFTTEKELPEGVEFKRRTPWDRRPNWWVEE